MTAASNRFPRDLTSWSQLSSTGTDTRSELTKAATATRVKQIIDDTLAGLIEVSRTEGSQGAVLVAAYDTYGPITGYKVHLPQPSAGEAIIHISSSDYVDVTTAGSYPSPHQAGRPVIVHISRLPMYLTAWYTRSHISETCSK
jgi:hypothetical protein